MGYVIEPRIMSCVYNNYPYVGDGWTSRWFVFDEETGAVLANNKGRGYKTFQKAYLAYQWQLKGPPSVKVHQHEQELLYDWSLKNKIITDRLDRIAMHYEEEGKPLTPKHIKVLFETQKATCPIEEDKFLVGYQHDFYEDVVLERRAKAKRRAELKAQWDLKKRFDDYAETNVTAGKLRDFSDRTAVLFSVLKEKIGENMRDYEERPTCEDPVARARALSYVSAPVVTATNKPFRGHEWEIVEPDPNVPIISDTFGQEGVSSVGRVMDRQYTTYEAQNPLWIRTATMVDPITYQIVPARTSRCVNAHEWRQMAGPPKKKKRRPVPPEKAPMTTQDWVGMPDEETAPKKEIPRVSKSKIRVEPEHANASISIGSKGKKKRPRPEGLPPKAEPKPKPPIKDRVRKKMDSLKEEWSVDDDEYDDDEEYEIPTIGEAFTQMKNSIKTFFADVKNEADKQKADEQAAKEDRKKARADKKAAKRQEKTSEPEVMESPAEDFINSIVPDITLDKTTDGSHDPEELLDELFEELTLDEQDSAHE